MTTLLTVESLIFAMLGLSVALLGGSGLARQAVKSVRVLMIGIGVLITIVAVGALVSWGDSFLCDWPDSLTDWVPVACIGLGIVIQPVLAWLVVWLGIRRVQVGTV